MSRSQKSCERRYLKHAKHETVWFVERWVKVKSRFADTLLKSGVKVG